MKKIIAIPLAVFLLLAAAGAGGTFYLYSQGVQSRYATALVATSAADKAVTWYKEGFEKYNGVFLPGTTINGTESDTVAIKAYCRVKVDGKTGVEMEALTGVSVALLTIYDMCKAIDKRMVISDIHLLEKSGGKSGDFKFD